MKRKMNCLTKKTKRSTKNIDTKMTSIQNILFTMNNLTENVSLPTFNEQLPFRATNGKCKSKGKFIISDSILSKCLQFEFEHIFNYLMSAETPFESKFNAFMANYPYFTRLRTSTVLSYMIACFEMIQSLWIVYRQSAAGDLSILLEIQNIDRTVIPKHITRLVEQQQGQTNDASIHLNFIDACLYTIRNKHRQYQHQLVDEVFLLSNYNEELQNQIKLFIQQELKRLKIEIDYQIELVYYAYKDEIYKRYCSLQLHQQQINELIDQLCQHHYHSKTIQSNINLWKYLMAHEQLKEPSHIYRFTTEPFLHNTQNLNLQQDLCQQYFLVTEHLRMDTFNIEIYLIEEQQQSYQKDFQHTMRQLWNSNMQLTSSLKEAIYERIKNITEQIKCTQNYRYHLIQFQS